MSAHTPGPWEVHVVPSSGYRTIRSTTPCHVVGHALWVHSDEATDANAALQAAAPDMAEALRDLLELARMVVRGERSHIDAEAWHAGEAALKKASPNGAP